MSSTTDITRLGDIIETYVDSSLLIRDISINNIYSNGVIPGLYVNTAVNEQNGLSSACFQWVGGILRTIDQTNASTSWSKTEAQAYIDTADISLGVRITADDTSIAWLNTNKAPIESPTFTGVATSPTFKVGNWKITLNGNDIYFTYNEASMMALSSTGELYITGDLHYRYAF
jgi:hypothetical protein